MTKSSAVPMVRVIYNPANTARHTLYGTEVQDNGRRFNYGYRKSGDNFNVAESDVLARPGIFTAYPCGKPFEIENGKLINPCGSQESVEKVGGTLEEIPGVGPKIAQKLLDKGIDSPELVAKQLTESVMKELKIPPRARGSIKKWQESQAL